ncbi:MAG: nuclear transport factor 2 family protein [Sneathiella sp.]
MTTIQKQREAIVKRYAEAKNQRDIETALKVCTDSMVLHSASLDTVVTYNGHNEFRAGMARFYALFSGYSGKTFSRHQAGIALVSHGEVTLRMNPDLLINPSSDSEIVAPFLALYEFEGMQIASEKYYPQIKYAEILSLLNPEMLATIVGND